MFDELVETGKLSTTNTETGKLTTKTESVAHIDTAKTTTTKEVDPDEEDDLDYESALLEVLAEGNVTCVSLFFFLLQCQLTFPEALLCPSSGFDPKSYFRNWSIEAMAPTLNEHGQFSRSHL